MTTIAELQEISLEMRKTILRMTNHAGMGHVGGSLSAADILSVLYFHVMHIDPLQPALPERDRFILSKGHCTPGYYAALALRGYFDMALLNSFDATGTALQGHPDMHKCIGVDYSSGSLGQGLSIGIGMLLGAAALKENYKTYVLMGDGECQEGQVWEAFLYAGARRLRNLVTIVDHNRVQLSSTLADGVDIDPLAQKISTFGWRVIETDGHDLCQLLPALQLAAIQCQEGPVAVIANTVKGKGVSFMEGQYQWHGKAPNDQQLEQAIAQLDGRNAP
jgi:transketolase